MNIMQCKCCGANENRIDGFCSVECKNYYDLETRIAELEAENEKMKKRVTELAWTDRPTVLFDLKTRIAELEAENERLGFMAENQSQRYTRLFESTDKLSKLLRDYRARIAELEAENDMLKQLSQPIEFWSVEKIQIYKSNESRTEKSGNEEREE